MKSYHVLRMHQDGRVGCDYGWGNKDWMMNMMYKEIEFCMDDEYVKIEKEEEDDWDDWDDEDWEDDEEED